MTGLQEEEAAAIQHRVNKLKQHHRKAFDLISRALKLDEEEKGSRDGKTSVEMYKRGINELEKGILLEFDKKDNRECSQAVKLQHKMKLNLDMAKKRLNYHQLQENRKSQSVLKHLSLPRTGGKGGAGEVGRAGGRRDRHQAPLTPQPSRKFHKRCMSGSDTLPRSVHCGKLWYEYIQFPVPTRNTCNL